MREIDAGEVTVTITPTRLDASGGEFTVAFDTHTVSLDLDVAARSRLDVDGVAWAPVQWSGDGPGSHHRAGTLRFGAAGPARGLVRLTISGLATPVEASWNLPRPGGA